MRDILVGMGETVVSQDRDVVLTALGLGSCIGIFAYDYRAMVGDVLTWYCPMSPAHMTRYIPRNA